LRLNAIAVVTQLAGGAAVVLPVPQTKGHESAALLFHKDEIAHIFKFA
jgi:hypothetical protein